MACQFCIKEVLPENAEIIWPMILELYEHLQKPSPETDVCQLEADLKSKIVEGMLIYSDEKFEELVAYALYFFLGSIEFGKVLILEDIYVRKAYRRYGLGKIIFAELAKISANRQCYPFIEWFVIKSNKSAIAFYDKLEGSRNMARNCENPLCWWAIRAESFEGIKRKQKMVEASKFRILIAEKINEQEANSMAKEWFSLTNCANLLDVNDKGIKDGYLDAVFAEKVGTGEIVGMALFTCAGYSSWAGQFLFLDGIFVRSDFRRNGIGTAIFAELAEIAQIRKLKRIQWKAKSNCDESLKNFFSKLKAVKDEDDMIYRWDYGRIQK